MRLAFASLLGLAFVATSSLASAVESGPPAAARDKVRTSGERKADKAPDQTPFRGSTFLFDQSMSTQSLGVGGDYQSRNPIYEHWYSFRPRYTPYNGENDSFDIALRIDVFHELTNSDASVKEREPLLGDPFITPNYGVNLYKDKEKRLLTRLQVGPRFQLGLSKASQGRGQYGSVGAGFNLIQQFPIADKESPVFKAGGLSLGFTYNKPITRCTTACNPDFVRIRQDTEGRSFGSDVLSGGAMINHGVIASAGVTTDVTDKLHLGITQIWVMQWVHRLSDQPGAVATDGGLVEPTGNDSPTNLRVLPWFLASIDYDVIDELALGIGYYNFTPQLAPDGQRRNPIWSPDARFFFSVTANLDPIYKRASGSKAEAERKEAEEKKKTGRRKARRDLY
jgi:hypothetical protein